MNPQQRGFTERIKETVERSGVPRFVKQGRRITIEAPSGKLQCLIASNSKGRPLAVALYGRPELDLLRIEHLVVHPESGMGQQGSAALTVSVVRKIGEIARRIEGVKRIQLPYRHGRFVAVNGEALR